MTNDDLMTLSTEMQKIVDFKKAQLPRKNVIFCFSIVFRRKLTHTLPQLFFKSTLALHHRQPAFCCFQFNQTTKQQLESDAHRSIALLCLYLLLCLCFICVCLSLSYYFFQPACVYIMNVLL